MDGKIKYTELNSERNFDLIPMLPNTTFVIASLIFRYVCPSLGQPTRFNSCSF